MRFKPPANCVQCGVPMRPGRVLLSAAPGTVKHRRGGLCENCVRHGDPEARSDSESRECDRCGIRRQVTVGRPTNLCRDCFEVVKVEGVLDLWVRDVRGKAA